jgi:hypothetical protein
MVASEPLDPGSELHLPGPSAPRLLEHMEIVRGDSIGIEHRVGFIRSRRLARISDCTIDHEMRDVDTLRREFARHALGEAAKCEFSHRKRRRLRIPLDACGCAGEEDGTMSLRQHASNRLLGDGEAAE